MAKRIDNCFNLLKSNKKKALITFLTAGDPNYDLSLELIETLPKAGADIVEIGMPFSDPMADGPVIQRSYIRALKSGSSLIKTLKLVESFRITNNITPVVLMGYYNPILQMGLKKFISIAKDSGVDGVLIVDLPPEVSNELSLDLDGTAGEIIMRLKVDGDDFVFKQYDGTETFRLTDAGSAEVKDNLSLKSDAAVLNFGTDSDITLTHAADTSLTLGGAGNTTGMIVNNLSLIHI